MTFFVGLHQPSDCRRFVERIDAHAVPAALLTPARA